MDSFPSISIIVPIYNVEQYLNECLDSFIPLLSLNNCEVICVDDGSTDNSKIIAERYVEEYPTLYKVFNKENGGLSSARNYGISKAENTFIGFVDADDWINPKALINMLNLANNNVYDVVVSN